MITFQDVCFTYGDNEEQIEGNGGLHHINLTIPDGQTVLLCGESGCGKTTVTRLINGLIPHFYEGRLSGSVQIGGIDILQQPLYETAFSVGTVFQNPRSQFFNVDTTSELAFGLENRGTAPDVILEQVRETVKECKLESLMDRSIFKLSGGEKQKIACGCVAVCSPEIIILDEPSSNLDLHSMEQLKKMIQRFQEQGKTIVIAEHRLSYIWNLIDRAIYLQNGQIMEDMNKEKIIKMNSDDLHARGLRSNSQHNKENGHLKLKTNNSSNEQQKYTEDTIQFRNFFFEYEKHQPILDFNKLEIRRHEITAVVGNNGLGKSTFLRCICGLEPKCKGVMELDGKEYSNKKRLREIFLVMQDVDHQLFTESVLDEVLISMKDDEEEKALQILQKLDLLEYKDRHPISLSGGQKQRVAVATAIASEREILLFDEPTSGLDYRHMLQVAGLFERLKRQGKTIIVVTHDVELIQTLQADVLPLENLILPQKENHYEKRECIA